MGELAGKIVGNRRYFHICALDSPDFDNHLLEALIQAETLASVKRGREFNVFSVDRKIQSFSLLNYPDFFSEGFPILKESWAVNLVAETASYRTYHHSHNPPILHRKELLLPQDHPQQNLFCELTEQAVAIGLFEDTTNIGFLKHWEELTFSKGYQIVEHQFLPLGNEDAPEVQDSISTDWQSARHRTAMVRYNFSAPIQSLSRHGLIKNELTLFDYGCGKGDDIRGLVENGIQASGWDPYYAPEQNIQSADIVNLGFVINVIEDPEERREALANAYKLTEKLLVVSVMLSNSNNKAGDTFSDGVLTQRGTFQKYFSQTEIKTFIEQVTGEEPIPVAPGVIYVFKDKEFEQQFLVDRQRTRRNLLSAPRHRLHVSTKTKADRVLEKYELHKEILDDFWLLSLRLGRKPHETECVHLDNLISEFGSINKTFRLIREIKGDELLETARDLRIDDLKVYLALNIFQGRRPYKTMEKTLQLDIKTFFGSIKAAEFEARKMLYEISDTSLIEEACKEAKEKGLGRLIEGKSLELHVSMVEQLPPILRIYIGCSSLLYGDFMNADLVKIHITSGKVTLCRFDDFDNQALPSMIERAKVKLIEQDVEYFDYGQEHEPPLLYLKSRYINEEYPEYSRQLAFDEDLKNLGLFDFDEFGPKKTTFESRLSRYRWEINGFKLSRSSNIPDPEEHCGFNFRYADFIYCGETQKRTSCENLPKQPQTYTALADLSAFVLDPIIDYFGMIELTYGFASSALAKLIKERIDPSRDQHASHEVKRTGRLICERKGAAVDFLVADEDMLEVAQWVVSHTPFDRLYFYGKDRPLHVSFGPDNSKQIVLMLAGPSGKRVPKVQKLDSFLKLN